MAKGTTAWRIIGGQAVLVSIPEGRLHLLNQVGTRIWELIQEKRKVQEIVERITEEFEVPREKVESDVRSFIVTLAKQKLCSAEQVNPNNA